MSDNLRLSEEPTHVETFTGEERIRVTDDPAGTPVTGYTEIDDMTTHVVDSYTPADVADWDGSADPGGYDDAVDQLAARLTDVEEGGAGMNPVIAAMIFG